jgi:Na+/H+ antiporter NhaC
VDLVLPNLAVIILVLLSIAWLGGYFGPEKISLVQAYTQADTTLALNYGCFGALLICFLLYIPRRILPIRRFFEGAVEGMKSMFTAILILVMAWSLSTITSGALGAGAYIESIMARMGNSANLSFVPLMIFLVSAVVSFGLGSWGAFLITVPFIAIIARATDPSQFYLFLAATLAGSVFGDHASPITDTTILASVGANCDHISHVKTQFPYALLVCLGSAGAFTVMGVFKNPALSWAAGALLIITVILVIYQLGARHE